MSHTLELLRMVDGVFVESGPPFIHRGSSSSSSASDRRSTTTLTRPTTAAATTMSPSSVTAACAIQAAKSAKVIATTEPHSYYDCCINVHVSSLLEHWLDWDSSTRSNDDVDGISTNTNTSSSINTAKSLSTSCDCLHHRHSLFVVANDSPASQIQKNKTKQAADFLCASAAASIASGDDLGDDQAAQDPVSRIRQFCADGCDVNRTDSEGKTILHYLLEGNDVKLYGNSLVELTGLLLDTGARPMKKGFPIGGSGSPFLHVRHLLRRGLFSEASKIAGMMLDVSEDEDEVNQIGGEEKCRTLLSYSVTYGDSAAELTRTLLNRGAKVWPVCLDVDDASSSDEADDEGIVNILNQERDRSAFSAFFRSIMERRTLEGSEITLELLCQAMGEEPRRMKSHVTRTMLQLGKAASVNGPLFLRVKSAMAPYWSRPQTLKYQCLKRIRRSLGPKRLNNGGVSKLRLPPKLQRYVRLEDIQNN